MNEHWSRRQWLLGWLGGFLGMAGGGTPAGAPSVPAVPRPTPYAVGPPGIVTYTYDAAAPRVHRCIAPLCTTLTYDTATGAVPRRVEA